MELDFVSSFLLGAGVLMTEVTLLIFMVKLIWIVMDTIMMTIPMVDIESGVLVLTTGLEREVYFILVTTEDDLELLAPLCSPEETDLVSVLA